MADQLAQMPYRVFNRLFESLQNRSDGRLCMSSESQQWHLYLLDGKLLYIWGNRFAVRRFRRAARHYRPNWRWEVQPDWIGQDACWEIALLEQAIAEQILSPIQLKLMLRMILQECSVEMMHNKIIEEVWQPLTLTASSTYSSSALSETEIRGVFRKASHIHKNWQVNRLRYFNLNDVPIVTDGNKPSSFPELEDCPELENCLKGETTLWDILLSQEPSMPKLASLLGPLIEDERITVNPISDLPLPIKGRPVDPSVHSSPSTQDSLDSDSAEDFSPNDAVSAPRPMSKLSETEGAVTRSPDEPVLIACIDDSPVLTLSLTKILTEAGYRTLSIPEPMRGFSELIEHQPDLILLDLMLPNADGYSICKFLRETPVFAKTPIIILTGQDSKIDRMRAQLVGATDFLSKPPQASQLLKLIEQNLLNKI